jgi:hypothetical protein
LLLDCGHLGYSSVVVAGLEEGSEDCSCGYSLEAEKGIGMGSNGWM